MRSIDARIVPAALAAVGLLLLAAPAFGSESSGAEAREGSASAAVSDARAVEIARSVLAAMGGAEAWEATRYVSWRFFGRRLHFWDRHTGDIRSESPARRDREGVERPALLVLMNVHTRRGRAWENEVEVLDPAKLGEALDLGHQMWVNDSYWMFMPYKLLDPGVRLRYAGERPLADGRPADVLDLTFEPGVGYTPENRYEVYVGRDSGLVEQWSFYAEASAGEPQFTLPWAGWMRFGRILLATDHGEEADWEIAVHDTLPAAVFTSRDRAATERAAPSP